MGNFQLTLKSKDKEQFFIDNVHGSYSYFNQNNETSVNFSWDGFSVSSKYEVPYVAPVAPPEDYDSEYEPPSPGPPGPKKLVTTEEQYIDGGR